MHKQKEAGAVGNREKTAVLRQVIFIFPVKTNARKAQDGVTPSAVKDRVGDTEKSGCRDKISGCSQNAGQSGLNCLSRRMTRLGKQAMGAAENSPWNQT
ncbi:hypothetical protein [Agrobacterium vitis]|uniref:Uncharacterized protein n=1 Tax=Agrobacterium vitis TaxID=373 RepID=A0A7K1RKC5_AGRVI|nr:hypothetical protein [Agrobacterium vitis]MVA58437.1 hypothetical protein [Agrobacterium vitis]